MGKYDDYRPGDKWEFNENVADCFENMLERSIPQYEVMRESVADLAFDMINNDVKKESFSILDIGCSDGLMLEKLLYKFVSENELDNGKYVGVDVSEPMIKKAKYRFLDEILNNQVSIYKCDLRSDFPQGYYDIVTSILSIQFTPIE